ncbi:unnamed protein product [Protopolystoma xenopodis]|uniref:Uncharacterized protein n=1 Tax=Protopolystoma xenopodis TaxID=117903 RepID=A0A448WJA1_9PLAT|nr:unnamed protein product [Protopolystoma xenopodis]
MGSFIWITSHPVQIGQVQDRWTAWMATQEDLQELRASGLLELILQARLAPLLFRREDKLDDVFENMKTKMVRPQV